MNSWQIIIVFYVLVAAGFIISENRKPQATFAWIFLFLVLPLVGLVIYLLFGRDYKAFSRRRKLNTQEAPDQQDGVLGSFEHEHSRAIDILRNKPEQHARLATLIHSNTNSSVTLCNRVQILQNAAVAYPALMETLKAAKSSIHLQYYIWAADTVGQELQEILATKAREGVEVRILYDPVGSILRLNGAYMRAMRAAGIKMRPFSALWRVHTISYRNHRKIAIIDGKTAFTGGMNIGDEHLVPPKGFGIWRDTNIRVEGSAARSLQGIFAVDWLNATGEALESDLYFPEIADTGSAGPQQPMQICLSGPDSEWHAIRQLYFAMITSANTEILITSPYFILDATISAALCTAALSGVKVRIMVSARGPKQYIPYWAANTFIADVAKAGATVLLYQAGYLHAKTLCIDGEVCAIGSANMDIRSFSINYEQTAVIYDKTTAAQLQESFRADTADCTLFAYKAYRKSRFPFRFRDSLARLASPLL